jgi:glycosyltransferase involved in cell wall biosynthesis
MVPRAGGSHRVNDYQVSRMPKLSIIVPTHEDPHRLELCLEGIALQVWRGLDVHVVDDGGTCDATPALVADYSRRMDVRYHYVERDGMRLATCRNVGLRFARCSRVLIIDQDCVVAPGALQGHAEYAESPVIVIGIKQCIPEPSVAGLGAVDVPRLASLVDPQWEAKYAWVRALCGQVVPTVCECVAGNHASFPTAVARAVGGYWEEFRGWGFEDYEFACRMGRAGCQMAPRFDLFVYHLNHQPRYGDSEAWEEALARFHATRDDPAVVIRNGGPLRAADL